MKSICTHIHMLTCISPPVPPVSPFLTSCASGPSSCAPSAPSAEADPRRTATLESCSRPMRPRTCFSLNAAASSSDVMYALQRPPSVGEGTGTGNWQITVREKGRGPSERTGTGTASTPFQNPVRPPVPGVVPEGLDGGGLDVRLWVAQVLVKCLEHLGVLRP